MSVKTRSDNALFSSLDFQGYRIYSVSSTLTTETR